MPANFVTLKRLAELEDALARAIEDEESYRADSSRWNGFESLGTDGRKTVVLHQSHFDEVDRRQKVVTDARTALHAARAEWVSYGSSSNPFSGE